MDNRDRDTRTMDKVDTRGTDLPRDWDSRDADRRTMDKVDRTGADIGRERNGNQLNQMGRDYDRHVALLSASTLAGTPVTNRAGEDLGHLEEIMLDVRTGNVAYAVISFGGILGIGSKLFAVPWQALQIDQDEEQIIMDVDKAKLENAPGFDEDDWPNTAEPNWLGEVYTYYGYTYPLI